MALRLLTEHNLDFLSLRGGYTGLSESIVENHMSQLIFYFNLIRYLQSNLDYSKYQGPQESFRIIGSSNDRKQEFSDIFVKARMLS